ncbi:MAG: peptide ABC transporter substrate-binding protein, partial [Gammaproteobacteria bacterium]|nr:peptide ABC transporter substrate-binding protein [Gammaproteobacteria bacterium]
MRKTLILISIALSSAVALAGTAWAAERGRDGELRLLYWQAPSTMLPYLSRVTKEQHPSSLVSAR